jgi:hypothetical protein
LSPDLQFSNIQRLLLTNTQDTVQDVAKDVESVVRTVAIAILVIKTVFITALETLLEVVLILAAVYEALVSVRTTPINIVTVVTAISAIAGINLTLLETLSVSVVYSLSEKLGSAIVRLIVTTISVNAVPA